MARAITQADYAQRLLRVQQLLEQHLDDALEPAELRQALDVAFGDEAPPRDWNVIGVGGG